MDIQDKESEATKWRFTLFEILAFLAGIFILLGLFLALRSGGEPQKELLIEEPGVSPAVNRIKVDVSGAVEKPGVYELEESARVIDALKAAGGLSALADREFISKSLSLALKVSDGGKLYIPQKGETAETAALVLGMKTSPVSLNRAGESELDTLPGVGPATAQKIIGGRPYQNIEELVVKKIVSKSVFEKIKEKISL